MFPKLCTIPLILSVAACGGSTSVPFRTITESSVSNASLSFEIDRFSIPDQITFDPNPETDAALTFLRVPARDLNGFEAYETADGTGIFLRSGTDNSAVATIVTDGSVAEGFVGSIIARNSPTDLPVSGTASYTGDYAGILTADATGNRIDTVTGDVDLTIDFGTELISGTISNRALSDGRSLEDEILAPASTIVDGATTGFVYPDNPGGDETASGGFAALVAGPNAEEIVGYAQLEYTIDDVAVTENGSFRASR